MREFEERHGFETGPGFPRDRRACSIIAFVIAALALAPWDAAAGGVRLFVGTVPPEATGVRDPRVQWVAPNDPRVLRTVPNDPRVLGPRSDRAPVTPDHHHGRHHRPRVIVVPQSVYVVESPPRQCWVPGFWSHQWVPQTSTSYVWMAGHWSPDGQWVAGHYAPYTFTSGSYQPVWVPERWVC